MKAILIINPSSVKMKRILNTNPAEQIPENVNDNLSEYPFYPESEDIYNKFRKEKNTDPEDIYKVQKFGKIDKGRTNTDKGSDYGAAGSDLDIPGSELDDEGESIGNEDEENNYYSLGGDDHNDLDEDKNEF